MNGSPGEHQFFAPPVFNPSLRMPVLKYPPLFKFISSSNDVAFILFPFIFEFRRAINCRYHQCSCVTSQGCTGGLQIFPFYNIPNHRLSQYYELLLRFPDELHCLDDLCNRYNKNIILLFSSRAYEFVPLTFHSAIFNICQLDNLVSGYRLFLFFCIIKSYADCFWCEIGTSKTFVAIC